MGFSLILSSCDRTDDTNPSVGLEGELNKLANLPLPIDSDSKNGVGVLSGREVKTVLARYFGILLKDGTEYSVASARYQVNNGSQPSESLLGFNISLSKEESIKVYEEACKHLKSNLPPNYELKEKVFDYDAETLGIGSKLTAQRDETHRDNKSIAVNPDKGLIVVLVTKGDL